MHKRNINLHMLRFGPPNFPVALGDLPPGKRLVRARPRTHGRSHICRYKHQAFLTVDQGDYDGPGKGESTGSNLLARLSTHSCLPASSGQIDKGFQKDVPARVYFWGVDSTMRCSSTPRHSRRLQMMSYNFAANLRLVTRTVIAATHAVRF